MTPLLSMASGENGLIVALPAVFFDGRTAMLCLQDALLGGPRTLCILAAKFLPAMPRRFSRLSFPLLQGGEQPFAGELPVHELRTRILDSHADIGGQMPESDPRGDFIDILSARARRAAENFLQLRFVQCGDWFHRSGRGRARTGLVIADRRDSSKRQKQVESNVIWIQFDYSRIHPNLSQWKQSSQRRRMLKHRIRRPGRMLAKA
ncbi:MAG: hypothetical protein JWR26_1847 [Pedosphaera sp.]|nr:hypothetical protein [Pedosphaera sp.]